MNFNCVFPTCDYKENNIEEKEFLQHLKEKHHDEMKSISEKENISIGIAEMITISNSKVFINSWLVFKIKVWESNHGFVPNTLNSMIADDGKWQNVCAVEEYLRIEQVSVAVKHVLNVTLTLRWIVQMLKKTKSDHIQS